MSREHDRPSKMAKHFEISDAASSSSAAQSASPAASSSSSAMLPPAPSLKYSLSEERPDAWSGYRQLDHPIEVPVKRFRAVRWPDNGILIGSNTSYFPPPPPAPLAGNYIGTDGYWMDREYTQIPQPFDSTAPHLAFFPLPSTPAHLEHVFFTLPRKCDVVVLPNNMSKGRLILLPDSSSHWLVAEFDAVHRDYKTLTSDFAKNILPIAVPLEKAGHRGRLLLSAHRPARVIAAALTAKQRLTADGVKSHAEVTLYWRCLQRGALELVALINFFVCFMDDSDVRQRWQKFVRLRDCLRRGVILCGRDIVDHYYTFERDGVPVYALLHRLQWRIDEKLIREPNERLCAADVDPGLSTYLFYSFILSH